MGNIADHQEAYKKKQRRVCIFQKEIDGRRKNDKRQDACGIAESGFNLYMSKDHDKDIDEAIHHQDIVV
jgi:hypothetical protein